jgi:hypothetical protein
VADPRLVAARRGREIHLVQQRPELGAAFGETSQAGNILGQ